MTRGAGLSSSSLEADVAIAQPMQVSARNRTLMNRLVVVSSDSHVGPRLEADLRPYCPAEYLDRFDEYVAAFRAAQAAQASLTSLTSMDLGDANQGKLTNESSRRRYAWNLQTPGHYDAVTRL